MTGAPTITNVARTNVARTNVARTNVARTNVARTNVARTNVARTNVARTNVARTNVARTNVARTNVARTNVARTNVARTNAARTNAARTNVARTNVARTNVARTNAARTNATRPGNSTGAHGVGLDGGESDSVVYGAHQILQIGEQVSVWRVFVFSHQLTIDNHIKFAMLTGGKLEGGDVIAGASQGFASHPGSASRVASIPAINNLNFQALDIRSLCHRLTPLLRETLDMRVAPMICLLSAGCNHGRQVAGLG